MTVITGDISSPYMISGQCRFDHGSVLTAFKRHTLTHLLLFMKTASVQTGKMFHEELTGVKPGNYTGLCMIKHFNVIIGAVQLTTDLHLLSTKTLL